MKITAPRASDKSATYDHIAPHYDKAMRPLERWLLARLRAKTFAALPATARLLEVGAGTGANFGLYPESARGVASELSFKMLELARGKERKRRLHLVQNCAEKLPFADASFDAAVATLVFCSIASPTEAFAELRRVVRAGGTIALLEHVRPKGLLGYVFDALSILTVALFDDHFNRRTAEEAERAGLSITRIERHALGIINIIILKNNEK
ncbi:MAG: class I SAM-dependent methyltransferase [Pyrinomonadaceae bacterium]|nr:class I SAM-dependent methyltransferase [Pyrinomonadaceae bacterium]